MIPIQHSKKYIADVAQFDGGLGKLIDLDQLATDWATYLAILPEPEPEPEVSP